MAACGSDGDDLGATVAVEVEVDPSPGAAIAVADGRVWVVASTGFTDPGGPEPRHAVVQIDAATGEVVGTTDLPFQGVALALTDDAVWVAGTRFDRDDTVEGHVARVDAVTGEVTASTALGPGSVAADVVVTHGAAWVVDPNGDVVLRLDPETAEITDRVSIDGQPSSLAATDDLIWVAKPGTGEIRPIDPSSRTPGEALQVGQPEIIGAGAAGLWVADYVADDMLLIDTERRETARSVGFDTAPSRFAVGRDRVVVAESEERRLHVIEAEGGGATTVLEGRWLVDVALADDATVWAVDHATDQVVRIDLAT